MNKISTAELICQLYSADDSKLQDLLDRNDGVYLNIDEIHRWVFNDGSILLIDQEGVATFVNIETQPASEPWYKKIFKNKVAMATVAGGVLLAGGAVAGAMYFHTK